MANTQQDVRVKLSAEGMAEVIQAFQQVSTAAKKSGKESSEAFKELSKQFTELGKNLVGGLSIAYGVEQLKEFFSQTLETAEGLQRLSRQTGLSADTIQAFGRAARETGIGVEVANNGLQKFTAATGKAEIGSKLSADALADLGIKARDIQNMTADQRLALVAQRLAGISDPARRARDEMALFSRSGVELDQALIKLGTEGVDGLVNRMKELGVYLSGEQIAGFVQMKERIRDLQDETKGLATQFLTGLVPALDKAAQSLLQATTGPGASGFQTLGKIAGNVFNGILLTIETIGKAIGAVFVSMTTLAESQVAIVKDIFTGNWKQLASDAKVGLDQQKAIYANFAQEVSGEAKRLFTDQPAKQEKQGPGGDTTTAGTTSQAAAIARAKYNLLVTQLDNEQKLFETNAKIEQDLNESQYKKGLTSLQDYYARRSQIIDAEFQKRIDVAKRKAAAESALPIADSDVGTAAIQKQQQQAKLQGEIQDLEAQRQQEQARNAEQQTQSQTDLDNKRLATQVKLLELEGKKADAARLRLQLDAQALDLELKQSGATPADRTAAVSGFQAQGSATIGFGGAQKDASATLSELNTQIKSINDSVASGETFSLSAQQQILAIERAKLPLLQQEAAQMEAFAKASGDPTLIAQADAFNEKIKEIGTNINVAGQQMARLKQGVESTVGSGLNTFLKDAVSGTHTLAQSFRDAALSILSGLEQIAEKLIEEAVLKEIFGSLSGGGGGGSAGLIGAVIGAATTSAASGGFISGPGTSKSDSIPARLSDGEFVVQADSVRRPGVRQMLEAINAGPMRGPSSPGVVKYATGGAVNVASTYSSPKIVNVLDPTLLGDHLATESGSRAVLNVISKNPTKVRSSLG